MVGAGQLIRLLLFGLEYTLALFIVGGLMIVYVTFGGMRGQLGCRSLKHAYYRLAGHA